MLSSLLVIGYTIKYDMKMNKSKIINIVAYSLVLLFIIYAAFFYEPSGYMGGRAKGTAIALLLVFSSLYVVFAIYVYKKTRSMKEVVSVFCEITEGLMSASWQRPIVKKWRKFKKRLSHK